MEECLLGLGALSLKGAVKHELGQEVMPKLALGYIRMSTLPHLTQAGVDRAEEQAARPSPAFRGRQAPLLASPPSQGLCPRPSGLASALCTYLDGNGWAVLTCEIYFLSLEILTRW